MSHVEPLKFSDPETERNTYIDAFFTTLIDQCDGDLSNDKAIAILRFAGYTNASIARYVDDANQKVKKWHAKIIS